MIDHVLFEAVNIQAYPYQLPLFKQSFTLQLNSPFTIILGDNGSGKSSILKRLQGILKLISIALPHQVKDDILYDKGVKISPSLGRLKGFYFESLKFINYVEYVKKELLDAKKELNRVDLEYKDKSAYAKMMAKGPFNKTIAELNHLYTKDLSTQSHGESYLDFFASRIKDNGIYLLDEPETPLSTSNQLTLLSMIMDASQKGCQFIIATHSPILASLPNAIIYEIKDKSIERKDYDAVESFTLLKEFMNHKDHFLYHLTKKEK
ncbi:MAG: AAA family ATPase [Candidatus Izemoplasmataceae bacterium]